MLSLKKFPALFRVGNLVLELTGVEEREIEK